jgi:hypothetical protein
MSTLGYMSSAIESYRPRNVELHLTAAGGILQPSQPNRPREGGGAQACLPASKREG